MENFLPDDYVPLTIVDGIQTAPAYICNPTNFKLEDYSPNNEFKNSNPILNTETKPAFVNQTGLARFIIERILKINNINDYNSGYVQELTTANDIITYYKPPKINGNCTHLPGTVLVYEVESKNDDSPPITSKFNLAIVIESVTINNTEYSVPITLRETDPFVEFVTTTTGKGYPALKNVKVSDLSNFLVKDSNAPSGYNNYYGMIPTNKSKSIYGFDDDASNSNVNEDDNENDQSNLPPETYYYTKEIKSSSNINQYDPISTKCKYYALLIGYPTKVSQDGAQITQFNFKLPYISMFHVIHDNFLDNNTPTKISLAYLDLKISPVDSLIREILEGLDDYNVGGNSHVMKILTKE